MNRAEELCRTYIHCPSGDCGECGLSESEEMYKAQFLDELEELLNEEWFKGTEEQKERIIHMAEACVEEDLEICEEELVGAIWLTANSSIEDVRKAVARIY